MILQNYCGYIKLNNIYYCHSFGLSLSFFFRIWLLIKFKITYMLLDNDALGTGNTRENKTEPAWQSSCSSRGGQRVNKQTN